MEKSYTFEGIENEITNIFPKRLSEQRKAANLTQQQFADIMGISVAALSYYETGKRIPDIVFLTKISEFFGISADYFIGQTDSKQKENVNISDRLGLSDDAIEKIRLYYTEYSDCATGYNSTNLLNAVLEDSDFYSLLVSLSRAEYTFKGYSRDADYMRYFVTKKMADIVIRAFIELFPIHEEVLIHPFFVIKNLFDEDIEKEREQYGEHNPENE